MAKFLGSGGVQYLWTKAKKTFYENGNDITLKNGKKISVLAGDGTSTSNETVITSDGVTVGAVKNDMSDPYIGYKNAIDKNGLHIYGVDSGGNQDANERVDITSSGVKYSGAQGNGRTLKLGFEEAEFPRLIMDGNPGESKSVKIDFNDVIVQNESTTHKLSNKVDKVSGKSLSTNDYTNDDKAKVDKAVVLGTQEVSTTNGITFVNEDYVNYGPSASVAAGKRAYFTIDGMLIEDLNPLSSGEHAARFKVSLDGGFSDTSYEPYYYEVETIRNDTTHKLTEKADKTYVDSLKPVTFTVSVPTTGWSTLTDSNGETYYKLTITASNAISTGYPVCDVVLPDDIAAARLQENAYKCINKVSVGSGNVTLYCFEEIPSVAFTIRIQIARS